MTVPRAFKVVGNMLTINCELPVTWFKVHLCRRFFPASNGKNDVIIALLKRYLFDAGLGVFTNMLGEKILGMPSVAVPDESV